MTIISPPSLRSQFTLATLLAFSSAFFLWKSHIFRRRHSSLPPPNPKNSPAAKIFFASLAGTSKSLARRLAARLAAAGISAGVLDPLHYEPEELPNETLVFIVASTWENGDPPPNAAFLARWLAESAADFRVGSMILSRCRFAVFGVGSRAYGPKFNAAARDFARWMKELGAAEMVRLGEGDVDGGEVEKEFDLWCEGILRLMRGERRGEVDVVEEDSEEEEQDAEDDVVDLEDIAGKAPSRGRKGEVVDGNGGIKEMVTPIVRKNLEKQVVLLLSLFHVILYVLRLYY